MSDNFDNMIEPVEDDVADGAVELKSRMNAYTSMPEFESSDLFIPRLRLAQGLTAEVQDGVARPGQWLILGAEPQANVTIIPVRMTRRRELRKTDDPKRSILCSSNDGITGEGEPGGICAECPMSKWTKSDKGKNTQPPCAFSYSYIVYVCELDQLAVLEFSKTAINTGKMLNTMIAQRGLGNFAVTLSSSSQKGPAGAYYAPVMSSSKQSEERHARAKEMSNLIG